MKMKNKYDAEEGKNLAGALLSLLCCVFVGLLFLVGSISLVIEGAGEFSFYAVLTTFFSSLFLWLGYIMHCRLILYILGREL